MYEATLYALTLSTSHDFCPPYLQQGQQPGQEEEVISLTQDSDEQGAAPTAHVRQHTSPIQQQHHPQLQPQQQDQQLRHVSQGTPQQENGIPQAFPHGMGLTSPHQDAFGIVQGTVTS
jgi:hypothetical protein